MGSIYYHGTNEENAKKILKTGFRARTYFTWDLHSALVMGGMWVFGIYFKDKSPDKSYWQHVCSKPISSSKILFLRKFNIECIYDNKKADKEMSLLVKKEYHGDNIRLCPNCNGRGQTNPIPPYGKLKDYGCDACEKCNGNGFLRKKVK